MTLRSSDLQSDSDLDSIRNFCDVSGTYVDVDHWDERYVSLVAIWGKWKHDNDEADDSHSDVNDKFNNGDGGKEIVDWHNNVNVNRDDNDEERVRLQQNERWFD